MLKDAVKSVIEPIFNIADNFYLKVYYKNIIKSGKKTQNIDEYLKELKKVLVVAPHQDDESIGMGGTIEKMKRNKIDVDILYVTDGRMTPDDLRTSEIRLEEAKKSEAIYGINKSITIDIINKTLLYNVREAIEKIEKNVNIIDYDAIFLTGPYECNDDHVAVYDIIFEFVKSDKVKDNVQLYLYDINNSIQGEILNCVSFLTRDEAKTKWRAYDIFKSQKYITFSTIKIMDKNRLCITNKENRLNYEAAEFFCKLDKEEFMKKISIDNSFRKNMKTATSSIRLIKNMEENKKYRKLMK